MNFLRCPIIECLVEAFVVVDVAGKPIENRHQVRKTTDKTDVGDVRAPK